MFDYLCDDLDQDMIVELGVGCLSIIDDEAEAIMEVDPSDDEVPDMDIPIDVVEAVVGDRHKASEILSALSRSGWILKRA